MESETVTKNPILEMMARRDRERKQVQERNLKAREEKSQLEGVDYFDSIFDKKVLEIGNSLDVLEPSSDPIKIQDGLESIARDLQELQRFFTSSTIFLNDHKIQRCQNIINQLLTKSDETKARLVPKKSLASRINQQRLNRRRKQRSMASVKLSTKNSCGLKHESGT